MIGLPWQPLCEPRLDGCGYKRARNVRRASEDCMASEQGVYGLRPQLLLQRQHRLEEVAVFPGARAHIVRREAECVGIAALPEFFQLGPRERRRDLRPWCSAR